MALALSRRLGSSSAARSLSAALVNSCRIDAPIISGPTSCSGALADEWPSAGATAAGRGSAGPAAAAAASSWPRHLFVYAAAVEATRSSSSRSRNNSGSGGGSSVPSSSETKRRSRRPPDYEPEQLLASLGLRSSPATLRQKMCKLPNSWRQQGVLQHAAAVVAHLHGLGLEQPLLEQLFTGCLYLFSWPAEERAVRLFNQLMHCDGVSGLQAAEAARCFITHAPAAHCTNFTFHELAAILAHSQDSTGSPKAKVPAAQRTVAALLRRTPSAVLLVAMSDGKLRQQAEGLVALGCLPAAVAKLAWTQPRLLTRRDAAGRVKDVMVVLRDELGLAADEVLQLASKVPGWLTSNLGTLRERAAALAEGFGKEAGAGMVKRSPDTLNCDASVWRCNLRYMEACGVADPVAVLYLGPRLLHHNHAAPDFVARRLLLQRYWGLSAAQLYERHAGFLTQLKVERLVQRLQYVEHRGQLHRLPGWAAAGEHQTAWGGIKQQAGSTEGALALSALLVNEENFLRAVHNSELKAAGSTPASRRKKWDDVVARWTEFVAAHPAGTGPVWEWAQQAARHEIDQRLAPALSPELRQEAAGRQRHSSQPKPQLAAHLIP